MSIRELEQKASDGGDEDANRRFGMIEECMKTMDEYQVANCIILMKELIPEYENQIAIMIKNFVVDRDRSLKYLSKDEVELIEFLRENLKYDL